MEEEPEEGKELEVEKDAVEIKYAALTYYIPQLSPTTSWQVHLPIILDLDLYIKVQLKMLPA